MSTEGCSLVWKDVTVEAPLKTGGYRRLLDNVSGYCEPGHMLAVMGPSGCGKTTMLDTLAGRMRGNIKTSGILAVNGHGISLAFGKAAYVAQESQLAGALTVRETLLFAARIRLAGLSKKEMEDIVDRILEDMGLTITANTLVGDWAIRGISGGQKRRVSIAVELITSPQILFLDEPTSGLDSAAAFHVLQCVRDLATNEKRTVVAVIHQPPSEVYALFDKLLLLSAGRMVYFGDADRAVELFESVGLKKNPKMSDADFFLHSINPDFAGPAGPTLLAECKDIDCNIGQLIKHFRASDRYKAIANKVDTLLTTKGEPMVMPPTTTWISKTTWVMLRFLLNFSRSITAFGLRLVMAIGLAFTVGTVFFDLGNSWADVTGRAALLFFVVGFLTFTSISALPELMQDIKIFTREKLNGWYGTSTFVVANTLASLPFIFIVAMCASVVLYFLAGLRSGGGHFIKFAINLFLSLTVVESLLFPIGALVGHFLAGIAIGSGVLGIYMLVCGFFQVADNLPDPVWKYPLHYVAFHTYSFRGFMNDQFRDTDSWLCPPDGTGTVPPLELCSQTGNNILDRIYFVEDKSWGFDMAILVVMIICYRILFYLITTVRDARATSASMLSGPENVDAPSVNVEDVESGTPVTKQKKGFFRGLGL